MGNVLTRHQDIKKYCKNIDFITETLMYIQIFYASPPYGFMLKSRK
jgi:hypothetical protein